MEDNKEKTPDKKSENVVLEWISDNLRYILLFGGMALIVAIAVVLASVILDDSGQNQDNPSSVVAQSEDISEDSEDDSDLVETSSESEGNEETSEESVETDEMEETSENSSVLSEASEEIVSTITAYFNALDSSDADAAAAVVESLSDDNRQTISSGLLRGGYNNIDVYTYPGESDSEWVAFVKYYYTYSGFDTAVPALTQLYLVTGQDGDILIALETTLEEKMDYMSSILSLEDVIALMSEVQEEYDAVLADNPALAAYIESMS